MGTDGERGIELDPTKLHVFIGSMNAMPMMYARILRARGYHVLYIVDAARSNTLCRPEHHYPEIEFPYPDWIIEWRLPSQIIAAITPEFWAARMLALVRKHSDLEPGSFFLNGFFTSFAPFLGKLGYTFALSHGSDMDTWADIEKADILAANFSKRSVFRLLPNRLNRPLVKRIISNQFSGYSSASWFAYFPLSFNADGAQIAHRIVAAGGRYVQRYDANFDHLPQVERAPRRPDAPMRICSIVRFLFTSTPEGNAGYHKGNEAILNGLAQFVQSHPNTIIDLFEKGEDVAIAKKICDELGLSPFITWHKPMPFKEFVAFLSLADVCIDQVGDHWIGAGVYAMAMGLPLIANAQRCVSSGLWPSENPVFDCRTAEEISQALTSLSNAETCISSGVASKDFIWDLMSPDTVLAKCIPQKTNTL